MATNENMAAATTTAFLFVIFFINEKAWPAIFFAGTADNVKDWLFEALLRMACVLMVLSQQLTETNYR